MAKKGGAILVRMVSTAGTGYFYVAKRNPRKNPDKLSQTKFDPRAGENGLGKRVLFKEQKMK